MEFLCLIELRDLFYMIVTYVYGMGSLHAFFNHLKTLLICTLIWFIFKGLFYIQIYK